MAKQISKNEDQEPKPQEVEHNIATTHAVALLYEKLSRALNTPVHEVKNRTITIVDYKLTIQ